MKIKCRGLEGNTAYAGKAFSVTACWKAGFDYVATERCGADVLAIRFNTREVLAIEIEAFDGKNVANNSIRNHNNGATRCVVLAMSERLKQSIVARLSRELSPELAAKTTVVTKGKLYHAIQNPRTH